MEDRSPAASASSLDIFRPVVQEENFPSFASAKAFDDLIEFGVRLHCAVLKREDIALEVMEEGVMLANVADGNFFGVRKHEGWNPARNQF